MIRNLSENCKSTENTITQAECTENASATSPDGTAESKEDEDIGEKTGQTKKRYRSEKQKERTRQYKKKIRRAKKQMMREKKLAERKNSNDDHMTDNSWSFKPQGPEIEDPRTRLLLKSGNKIEPKSTEKNKPKPIENPAEQVSLQMTSAINLTTEEVDVHRYEGDDFDSNMNAESLSLKSPAPQTGCDTAQAETKIDSENIGVNTKPLKENLTETVSVQQSLAITQTAVDADVHENIIPDNNTEGDSVPLKRQEPRAECCTNRLLPQADEKTKSEKTGVDKKLPKEDLVESTSAQLRPVINITTETAVEEARHRDLILVDTADRQDIFGILSVYVHSSIHFDYDKDPVNPVVTTSPANDFEYVYFSIKEFWK